MTQYICLAFILLGILVHECLSLETRSFEKSQVTINNENNITVITDSDIVSFFAIGDAGGLPIWPYKTLIERNVASLMKDLAKKYNTHFQISLGDNFYLNGVKNVKDSRFKETFEEVFDHKVLQNSPWFFILGNHDHYGNGKAQIEYTGKSKRWIMPSFNYSIDVFTSNGAPQKLITLLMIDTIWICGNSPSTTSGPPKHASAAEEKAAQEYLAAFEQKLAVIANTSVPYILVAGHFPVFSIAEHGPTQCLVDKLRPLLHKYGVSAYFSGHDHGLQHLQETYLDKKVDYVVSGCANFNKYSTDHANDVPVNSLKFHWADKSFLPYFKGGLVMVRASKTSMDLVFYESTGTVLYTTTIFPRI